jgi:uncharacterized protein
VINDSHLQLGPNEVRLQWGLRIPLRDGVHLSATLYVPDIEAAPLPVIFILTPYVGQLFHQWAVYFASHGYPFLTVDVRGRGNSDGHFRPLIDEAENGFDVAEWLAAQPFCNGKVAMWGGSYGGYAQWATIRGAPPHLKTIVPVASPYIGTDIPHRNNLPSTYLIRWLTFVTGRASQDIIFSDDRFWNRQFKRWFESGLPFEELDTLVGNHSATFREWIANPCQSDYWDAYNPSAEEYGKVGIPVLTITGIYDGDQPGALMHYREHLRNAAPAAEAQHYLVIGPWDHAGTRAPRAEFAGIRFGQQSCVDLGQLHLQWYAWTMGDGPKPAFLKDNVAYYVTGAETWRYAESLEAITADSRALYLDSGGSASQLFCAGVLSEEPGRGPPDIYVDDPSDRGIAELEASSKYPLCLRPTFPVDNLADQKMILAMEGRQLIYHSAPFETDIEVSGFFRVQAWIAIDQPDADFRICVYEISNDGGSVLLTSDALRARYRQSLREQCLIATQEPLCYDFDRFTFVSRLLRKGSRIRLVIGPIQSMHYERNHNSGGVVARESIEDGRKATVSLFHDAAHPSVLHMPVAHQV